MPSPIIASFLIISALLLTILQLHMVPAALIGMLIFLISQRLATSMQPAVTQTASRWLAVFLVSVLIIVGGYSGMHAFSGLIGDPENLKGLMAILQKTVEDLKTELPSELIPYIPADWLAANNSMGEILKQHATELSIAGQHGIHSLMQILISIAIALLISAHPFSPIATRPPLASALGQRFVLLGGCFQDIVFAQIKISAVNTLLTAVFLLVILPNSGYPLPYSNILVLLTFITGLLPVIGNLISNTVITIVAASLSLKVAMLCLLFLILIHKLEYFVNAKIIGHKIKAKAWEILLALLLMEAVFGIQGILMAPILYAYIKAELKQQQWI